MALPADYASQWTHDYAEVIDLAKKLSPMVAVFTILPVEDGMPLGTPYFDPSLIDQLNSSIRQLAKEKDVRLIDANRKFLSVQWKGHYTVDGVHPTSVAYKTFDEELLSGTGALCSSRNGAN